MEIHSFRLDFFLGDSGKLDDERRELRSIRVNVCTKRGDRFELKVHEYGTDLDDAIPVRIEFNPVSRRIRFQIEDEQILSFVHRLYEKSDIGLGQLQEVLHP